MKDFIFIHIPKSAGQSMKRVLVPFDKQSGIRRTISAREHVKVIGATKFESLFSFAFVRNPWDRQVSFYKFILKTPSHHLYRRVTRAHLSFGDYIKQVLPLYSMVNESQKGYVYSKDGKLLVDFIGYFENLKEGWKRVCERIGVDIILPRVNTTQHQHYRQYYSNETIQIVKCLFEQDIMTFGYAF